MVAEAYSLERGYPVEPFLCEACSSFHLRQSQVPREIPEEERWSPARHRAVRDRFKAEQAALRAEEERLRALKNDKKLTPKEIVRCRVLAPRPKSWAQADKEERDQRRAAGLCTACGATPAPGYKQCGKCRAYFKGVAERARQRKAAAA